MTDRSDVSAIVAAFSKRQLAIIVAKTAHGRPGGSFCVDQAALDREPYLLATVSREQGEVVRIRAVKKGQQDGYYLVYDANYCQERVLWWSQINGAWFESHHCRTLREGTYTTASFIAGRPEEATNGS